MSVAPKVYLIRAGKNGEDEETALERNLAIVEFRNIPSLEKARSYEDIQKIVTEQMPDATPRGVGNVSGQLWALTIAMTEGDLVVLPRKREPQIALGRVAGPYTWQKVGAENRHTRPVKWQRTDVPRSAFHQDLLHSLGCLLTVCNIARNDAARRVAEVLAGRPDPGPAPASAPKPYDAPPEAASDGAPDLAQLAHDQIVAHIQSRFVGHALAELVGAALRADGWVTTVSSPGADGGVDILGGRGRLGLDAPRLCVQVKSQNAPADVVVFRALQGAMQTFKAEQGLLVSWGGFTKAVRAEARQAHFSVRLWDSRDVVEAVYRTYKNLPADIQAELPLTRVWMLVPEETGR